MFDECVGGMPQSGMLVNRAVQPAVMGMAVFNSVRFRSDDEFEKASCFFSPFNFFAYDLNAHL